MQWFAGWGLRVSTGEEGLELTIYCIYHMHAYLLVPGPAANENNPNHWMGDSKVYTVPRGRLIPQTPVMCIRTAGPAFPRRQAS